MALVTKPKRGASWKINKGYIEGVYLIGGRRRFRGLGRLDSFTHTPSGRLRTADQLDNAVLNAWHVIRDGLEAELGSEAAGAGMMGRLFEDWIKNAERKELAAGTTYIHRLCKEYYLEIAGEHPIEEMIGSPPRPGYDLRHAEEFTAGLKRKTHGKPGKKKPLSAIRINMYLGRLSSALRFAYRKNMLWRLPLMERVKEKKRVVRVPKAEHVRAIRARLVDTSRTTKDEPQRYYCRLHRLLFYMLVTTGARPGELIILPQENVDLARRAILLEKTKTGQPRIVRISRFMRGKLRAHFASHPGQALVFEHPKKKGEPAWRTVAAAGTPFRRHMEALGIEGSFKRLYGYRAGFSTGGLNDVQVSAQAMKTQLGHKDLQTTLDHYVAGLADAQLEMVDAMERGFFRPLFEGKSMENSGQAQ